MAGTTAGIAPLFTEKYLGLVFTSKIQEDPIQFLQENANYYTLVDYAR